MDDANFAKSAARYLVSLKLYTIAVLALTIPLIVRAADSPLLSVGFDVELPSQLPREVWQYYVPGDNPITAAKVKLGKQLFFDKRLSIDGTTSCATCHNPDLAFTDGKPVAEGVQGRRGKRNTPTLLNAMFNTSQFWDGRADSLEAQAKLPLINPDEMGNESYDQVICRLRGIPEYATQFKEVFGEAATIDLVAKAIASFERTLVSGTAPIDRYMAGDLNALSESAARGFVLFRGKARCQTCHVINQFSQQSFPFFTDRMYHNTGVAANDPEFNQLAQRARQVSRLPDAFRLFARHEKSDLLGRFVVTGNLLDIGAFRTPSLREVELTAPYFHDGSARTLADVVRYYIKGGNHNINRDWQLEPISLNEQEQAELIEFLKSLTSDKLRGSAIRESESASRQH
jgi:cytochrome c peroxidase